MKKMMKKFVLVISAALLAGACAQQLDDIDRVQNNVTLKTELKGEFYFRSTVIQAPYASMGYFVGDQNYQTERGVFEITEKTLYFYRTFEHVIGGQILGAAPDMEAPLYEVDEDGNVKHDVETGKPIPVTYKRRIGDEIMTVARYVYRGSPIAAFPIRKHFDKQRKYNPTTGEKTNEIIENSTDREWWERENMRVAWGANQVQNWDSNLSANGLTVHLLDEEADDYEAPVKVYNDDKTLEYFDYMVKKTVSAPILPYGYSGMAYIPACWYYPWYMGAVFECVSEQVSFRHSFMRVKPSDYVAWDYDDTQLKKFGYYRIERSTYDPTRGITYSGVSRRIRRFRIWENYEVKVTQECKAPNGDVYADCPEGEVCEPLTNGQFEMGCVAKDANDRLDYSKMTPKPIVYYLSEDFPRELVPESIQLAENWTKPFEDTVTARKGEKPGHAMFILCENNLTEAKAALAAYGLDLEKAEDVKKAQEQKILAGIDGHCVDMSSIKRNGDLRYSQLHSVNAPTSVGLYGYGPSSADPMTGEMLSANAYMYTPAMKRGANNAMVLVELFTGIRNFWETRYANHVKERTQKDRLGAVQGGMPKWTVAKAKAMAAKMLDPKVSHRLETEGAARSDMNWASARMAKLAKNDPHLAMMFVTDEAKEIMKDPTIGITTTEPVEDQVARLGMHKWGHFGGYWAKQEKYYKDSAKNGCKFLTEFADGAVLGIAREYASEMNQRVCDAAMAAENTAFDFGKFDELQGSCNSAGAEHEDGYICQEVEYAPGEKGLYWANPCEVGKLKTQLVDAISELEQTAQWNITEDWFPPDPLYTDTKHAVINNSQVALLDAIEEVRNEMILRLYKRIYLGVAEHEVGHTIGLRHNFEASTDAINFGAKYWNLKGQMDGANFVPYDMLSGETFYQSANSMRQMQSASVMDYSAKFNDRFDGVGMYDRAAVKYGYGGLVEVFTKTPATDKFDKYLANPEDEDPSIVAVLPDPTNKLEKMFKRIHYTHIPELWGNVTDMYERKDVPSTQIGDNVEVPYRFCSDEMAGRIPTCERWDSGVDSFEIVRNTLDDYENYWPLWGNSQDSLLYWPDRYYNRILRMFGAAQMHMQWWVADYQRFNHNDWWQKRFGVTWHEDANAGLAGAVAVADSVNTLVSTFGRPVPGLHGYKSSKQVFEPVPSVTNATYSHQTLISPVSCAARQLYTSFDYAGYRPMPVRTGAIYERLAAYQLLADPTTRFMATDTNNDIEKYLISYYSLFPKQLMNLFSGMLANRTDLWGWRMKVNSDGEPDHCIRRNITGPDAGDPEGDFWSFNPEPEYTFPTTRFRFPMLAAYYGLSLFNGAFDDSFFDVTRVYLEGHQTAITPSDDADVLTFEDPLSGKVYSAVKSKNSELFNPAVFMIEQLKDRLGEFASLQDLQNNYNFGDYQFILDKLELLRNMNHAYDMAIHY